MLLTDVLEPILPKFTNLLSVVVEMLISQIWGLCHRVSPSIVSKVEQTSVIKNVLLVK